MIKRTFVFSILALLILSTFASIVLAAGFSTGNSQDKEDVKPEDSTVTTCEDKETLRARIECRLRNKAVAAREAYASIEEACRDSPRQEACEALYKRSKECYEIESARERKICFVKESGLNIQSAGSYKSASHEAKRAYIILMLYEAQERIEKMSEEGKITTEQATSLITKIVEIKKMILNDEARKDIRAKFNELRKEFKEAKEGAQ
jgi:hypothetical protein